LLFKSELGEDFAICLRNSRVNHACKPNASLILDKTAHVQILFALKDIQPGEEITCCYYYPFFFSLLSDLDFPWTNLDLSIEEELKYIKNKMFDKPAHGVVCCPPDCSCFDPTIWALVGEGRRAHSEIMDLDRQLKTGEALVAGEKLLNIHRRLNIFWEALGQTYFLLFEVAVQRSEFLPRAMEYLGSAAELFRKICPYSEERTKKFEKLIEHPETHRNYLKIDKMQVTDLGESLKTTLNL